MFWTGEVLGLCLGRYVTERRSGNKMKNLLVEIDEEIRWFGMFKRYLQEVWIILSIYRPDLVCPIIRMLRPSSTSSSIRPLGIRNNRPSLETASFLEYGLQPPEKAGPKGPGGALAVIQTWHD